MEVMSYGGDALWGRCHMGMRFYGGDVIWGVHPTWVMHYGMML